MVIFTYSCVICGGTWSSQYGRSSAVCVYCRKTMVEKDSESEWQKKMSNAYSSTHTNIIKNNLLLENNKSRLIDHHARKNKLCNKIFRSDWEKEKNILSNNIHKNQYNIDDFKKIKSFLTKLSESVKKSRIRFNSINIARQQRNLNARELEKRKFQEYIDSFVPNRSDLLIRNIDYKRGNLLENHIRNNWKDNIYKTFNSECFLCHSKDDLTLDHLWLPKNEGGNFVMCIKEGRFLISNILLLCRSCNASKGEAKIEHFFTENQIDELREYQKNLSKLIREDKKLVRVANKWY